MRLLRLLPNLYLHHHHHIEEPQGKMIWHPRWFFHLQRGAEYNEHPIASGHLEFVLSKPTPEFAVSLEVGTRGSETPFDGHLKVLGTTLYWGTEQGGRLADRLTQLWLNRLPNRITRACLDDTCNCPAWNPGATVKRHHGRNGEPYQHRYDGREFALRIWDGALWKSIWTWQGSWTRGEFAAWRDGRVELNPINRLLGEPRYWYRDYLDPAHFDVELPEGRYPVKATLQLQLYGRPKSKRRQKSWTVDVEAPQGIPNRFDHSGGWKGDRVYGFAVPLRGGYDRTPRRDWYVDAKAAIEARILQDRADSGFRTPQATEENAS